MLKPEYEFELMSCGNYQVRLEGEFVAYTNHTDEREVDNYLLEEGFNSRKDFLNYCFEEYHKEVIKCSNS